MSRSQYDAPALRIEVRSAIEAFRSTMRNISTKARHTNERFDEDAFDREIDVYVEDMTANGSAFISLIDEADEALGHAEAADGYEPGEHYVSPSINPEFRAAE